MFSEFLSYLFCFFTILQAFPGDTLVPNKPDALCDEPINSEVRQPTNTGLFYVQRRLLGLLIIYMVHLFASPCVIFNVTFFVSLFIYSAFIRKASSYKPLHR